MGFFFNDPNVERMPPTDIHFLDLRAEADPGGILLKVGLNLTPFQEKPYIELILTDSLGVIVSSTSIIEPVTWNLELHLHIRKLASSSSGVYKLTGIISYPQLGEVDRRDLNIKIPSPAE